MKCDLCGSKKDVRSFYGYVRKTFYKECRKCFERSFRLSCQMCGVKYSKEDLEKEWERGN